MYKLLFVLLLISSDRIALKLNRIFITPLEAQRGGRSCGMPRLFRGALSRTLCLPLIKMDERTGQSSVLVIACSAVPRATIIFDCSAATMLQLLLTDYILPTLEYFYPSSNFYFWQNKGNSIVD